MGKFDVSGLEGKKAVLQELLPALRPRDVFDPVAAEMRRLVIDHLKIDGARLDDWVGSKRTRRLDTTQVKGMQRARGGSSQVAVIELEVIALLLLEPARLRERLFLLEAALPPAIDAHDSLLREFHAICEECDFDDRAILLRYRERDEGRILFERLFSQEEASEEEFGRKIDVEGHIQKSLSRLRELYLDGEKEHQRKHLLERMQEVSGYLTDPNLPPEKLGHYYAELREINAMLAARDAERRMRMPPSLARKKR